MKVPAILDTIAAAARRRVEQNRTKTGLAVIRKEALAMPRASLKLCFKEALQGAAFSFICEVKRASPSAGIISEDFPYLDIARDYETAGASAISVLTEPDYFKGNDRYLAEIAQTVNIPVLRKDFIIDEYQIYETKLLGASALLLICALLDKNDLARFIDIARSLGLDALVETHDEAEIRTALSAGAEIIGVNNRNLKDFSVDIQNSLRLRPLVPHHIPFVAESGIKGYGDIKGLAEAGVNAALIGESAMKAADKTAYLASLRV